MSQRITYYYAIASGFAYLGEPELRRIAALAGAEIDYRPVDMPRVFAESGTIPSPKQSETRLNYRRVELARWAKKRGMPINTWPAHWPTDVKPASLAVLAAQKLDADPGQLSFALLRALWAEERNIANPGTINAIVEEAMPADAAASILAMMSDPAISATYDTFSNEAIAAGVFGAPTYIVGDEMFFGQDRLDFVAQALGVAE